MYIYTSHKSPSLIEVEKTPKIDSTIPELLHSTFKALYHFVSILNILIKKFSDSLRQKTKQNNVTRLVVVCEMIERIE